MLLKINVRDVRVRTCANTCNSEIALMLPPFVLSSYLLMGEVSETLMAFHRLYQGFSLPLPYFTLAVVHILPVLVRIFVFTCTSGSVIFSNISPSTCGLLSYMPSISPW